MADLTAGQLDAFTKARGHLDATHSTIQGIQSGTQATLETVAPAYQTSAGRLIQTAGAELLDVINTLKADLQSIGERLGTNASNYGNAVQTDLRSANKLASIINNLPH
jgi:hypothetical protein